MAKHKSQPEKLNIHSTRSHHRLTASFVIAFSLRLIGLILSPFKGPTKLVALPLLIGLCVWLIGGAGTYGYQALQHQAEFQSRTEKLQQLALQNQEWTLLRQAHPTARDVVIGQLNLAYQMGNTIELLRDQDDLLKIDPNSATVAGILSKLK